ncbi:MAG: dihydrofolate reductase [Alphaproteobacteria bacterium]|nr:dihydrofolate reductase [Alphaproteobacteria bacterium]
MRKLVLKMSMSLDGFVAGPKGELDRLFHHSDQEAIAWTVAAISDASLHIMGSKTFRDMVAWWPYADDAFTPPMNTIPKAVFTKHGAASIKTAASTQALKDAKAFREKEGGQAKPADPVVLKGWADAYVAEGPLVDEIGELKAIDGKPIVAHGGAGFARSLIAAGVVDEFKLLVHPVALGRGLTIFSDMSTPMSLQLVSATPFPGGAIGRIYRTV